MSCSCFNPQSLRRGTATTEQPLPVCRQVVSILSPSEEGLQPAHQPLAVGGEIVSILSPSEEGLQRVTRRHLPTGKRFQSSVPPKRDCNGRRRVGGSSSSGFNPQSLRRGTATSASPSRVGCIGGFNPQSLRRGTATRVTVVAWRPGVRFQSSVPPKRDCNLGYPPKPWRRHEFQSSVPPKRDCNDGVT